MYLPAIIPSVSMTEAFLKRWEREVLESGMGSYLLGLNPSCCKIGTIVIKIVFCFRSQSKRMVSLDELQTYLYLLCLIFINYMARTKVYAEPTAVFMQGNSSGLQYWTYPSVLLYVL